MSEKLVTTEQIKEHDQTVVRGAAAFIAVGNALMSIQASGEQGLRVLGFSTFDEYLGARGLSRAQGYRMIDAANVVEQLQSAGAETLPETERVARPLARVPETKRAAAWTRATSAAAEEGVKPAARHVEKAADEIKAEVKTAAKSSTPQLPTVATHEYTESMARLVKIIGKGIKAAIERGTLPKVDHKAVIEWSKQSDEMILKIEKLVAGGERWSVKQAVQFLAEMPNGKHRIERLCWLAMAEESGTWEGTINGVHFSLITVAAKRRNR